MSDTCNSTETTELEKEPCAWCGKPARMKCSLCECVYLCSEECTEKLHVTHKYVCSRMTPLVTDPNVSPSLGVGDPVWEAAHRGLRGEYYINKADGKVTMQRDYEPGEDRPDLFLILPALERQRVIEFLDVRSLCRMEQVMLNVYSSMAWFEALRGLYIPALSQWPHYTSAGKFAGLRWCMSRRVELRGVQIERVVDAEGREIRDEGKIFEALCENERWTDIACMLVGSGSIDPSSTYNDSKVNEIPILMAASIHGRLDVVKALLQAGADVDKADSCDRTALMIASLHGHTAVVEVLIQAGADIEKAHNFLCMTALIWASLSGHAAIVEALIQAGADIEKDSFNGATALMWASMKGHTAIAEVLLLAGADVDKTDNSGGTALMLASQGGHAAITEVLLQAGADVDKGDSDGDTALIKASQEGHTATAEVLLLAGADVNKADNYGWTALIWASQEGHTAVAEVLLQAGADVDKADSDGSTALIWASQEGHTAIAEVLLLAGADVDKANNIGMTALTLTRREGHSDIVKLLLEAGAR